MHRHKTHRQQGYIISLLFLQNKEIRLQIRIYVKLGVGIVSVAMGYGLDCRGSIPGRGKRFFSILQCPDRLWGPPSLL
jgi:hypothetical protein